MSAHTSGPWIRDGREVYVEDPVPNSLGEKRERMLVQVKTVSRAPREELVADAMLISAAPELLTACEQLCECIRQTWPEGPPTTMHYYASYKAACAAIGKAKGADQ